MNEPDWMKPDAALRFRCETVVKPAIPAIESDIATLVAANSDPRDGYVIRSADAASLVRKHGLENIEELMIALVPFAKRLARPPISNFFVGIVGLERETGDLVLGGNVEFPGTNLGESIHGEQFMMARSFSRGTSISLMALDESPCGHCRQFLAEFEKGLELKLVDATGRRMVLPDLLPWAFGPSSLGESGVQPIGQNGSRQDLRIVEASEIEDLPDVRDALIKAGRRAYVPYSGAVSAIALYLKGGSIVTGSALESVAYNPSLGPLQIALINLIAAGRSYADIDWAVLGTEDGAAVDYSGDARNMLARIAPKAGFRRLVWEQD